MQRKCKCSTSSPLDAFPSKLTNVDVSAGAIAKAVYIAGQGHRYLRGLEVFDGAFGDGRAKRSLANHSIIHFYGDSYSVGVGQFEGLAPHSGGATDMSVHIGRIQLGCAYHRGAEVAGEAFYS